MVQRLDDWQNVYFGFGGTRDPVETSTYVRTIQDTVELMALYETDWLARRIVEILPREALRRAPLIEGCSDSKKLWAAFKRLDTIRYPEGVFQRALCMGRLVGGHALLLGVRATGGASATDAPLSVGNGELAWIEDCEVSWLRVLSRVTDPNSAEYSLPEIYEVCNGPRKGLRLHASKVLLCEGLQIAPQSLGTASSLPTSHIFGGWQAWDSVLTPVRRTLAQDGVAWSAMSHLIKEASVGVLKMKGLIELLASKSETEVQERLKALALGKSVANVVFLDADFNESFERTAVRFTDLPDMIRLIVQRVCGAAEVPATVLFGQSPDGLNATGESDMRQHYDRVQTYREQNVSSKLDRILSIVEGKEVETSWESLWEPTPEQAAKTRLAVAQVDEIYLKYEVLSPEQLALSRTKDGSLGYDLGEISELERRAQEAQEASDDLRDNPIVPQPPPPLQPDTEEA